MKEEILTEKKSSKRFSLREEILIDDHKRFTQIKISPNG